MTNRNGFSLVELLIAIMVLTFGMLAMGSAMGYMSIQVRVADQRTQRQLAVAEINEQLMSIKYDSVNSVLYASATTVNGYKVWRTVTPINTNLKRVILISEGPGYNHGWQNAVQDTFTVSILRPFQ
jgi:prepilin-type N-terminal cleavage/methylation domain-containing protein